MMTNLLLATVIAFRLAGAAQSFDIPVQEGKAYHVTVTSHCDCYRPQPRMVAPIVEIFDVDGKPVAPATSSIRGVNHDISQYDIVNEKTGSIRFFPDGGSNGGRITVASGDRKFEVDVDWLTGRVAILD